MADEVEAVLPAEAIEDRHQDEQTYHYGVTHKLVRYHGVDEERDKDEGEDLREGHDVELFEILEELIMVITCNGLHQNANEHRYGEQHDLNHDDEAVRRENQSSQLAPMRRASWIPP